METKAPASALKLSFPLDMAGYLLEQFNSVRPTRLPLNEGRKGSILVSVQLYIRRCYNAAVPRRLAWIESQDFQGFGCSECNWKFRPSGAVAGDSLDQMKRKYLAERDKEFTAHTSAKRKMHADRKTRAIGRGPVTCLTPDKRHRANRHWCGVP